LAETTVVIADDHPIFRKGLRQIIEAEHDLHVVAEAGDGEEALAVLLETRPHVAVLDVDMPRRDGLSVLKALRAHGRDTTPVIFLTMHKQELFFHAALDAGVQGYVLKDGASTEIVTAIRMVADGRPYVTPQLTGLLITRRTSGAATSPVDRLTASERRVLRLVAEYHTSQQIADQLFISVRTVERHRVNAASKLGLSGAHAVLQFALEHKTSL
jgi:two-component system, NarL family, response regulator DegU